MVEKTNQRPRVKQNSRNNATPPTVLARLSQSNPCWPPPAPAIPKVMAMITQPHVSSMIAVVTMSWPRLRRMKFISRTTMATILMEEIDSAVPRNSDGTSRSPPLNRMAGPNWPSKKPQAKGKAMPHSATASAAPPDLRTSLRSVSMPVSSNSIRMPICDRPSIMPFWVSSLGNRKCWASGQSQPNRDGPRMIPANRVPISDGWPMRCMASPNSRPVTSSKMTSATRMASLLPLPLAPLPAAAAVPCRLRRLAGRMTLRCGRGMGGRPDNTEPSDGKQQEQPQHKDCGTAADKMHGKSARTAAFW